MRLKRYFWPASPRSRSPPALSAPAIAADMIGEGLTMYMQMGGNPGDGATLARQTGAEQAAAAFGVDLKEQFSAWAPETMINQFKEAVAATSGLHRDHGPSRRHRLPRHRQGSRGCGHRRHRRQLADDRRCRTSSAPTAWAMPASTFMQAAR